MLSFKQRIQSQKIIEQYNTSLNTDDLEFKEETNAIMDHLLEQADAEIRHQKYKQILLYDK